MNKVFLIGNVVKDIELQQTSSGVSFCNFTLAVNRSYKSDGETVTDFIPCIAWRGTAETLSKYTHKGDKLLVQGSIEIRNYEDRDGNKKTSTSINVSEIEFLSQRQNGNSSKPLSGNKPTGKKPQLQTFDEDSDIPF